MNNISLKTLSLAAITSALLSSVAIAQESADSLKMDVTFVGEREMVVKDALKLQSWPELRKLESGDKAFSYRLLAKRMNVTPVWTMLEPVRLRVDAPLARLYRGYARAGYGLYNTPLLELSMTDLRSREGTWGFQASHFATDAPSDFIDDRFQYSDGGVWLSRFIGKERVDLTANVSRDKIVFYGNANGESLAPDITMNTYESYLRFEAEMAFKSHQRDSTLMNHEVEIGWYQLRDLTGTVENNFDGSFDVGKFVGNERFSLAGSMNLDRLVMGLNNPDTLRTDAAIASLIPTATSYRGPLTVTVGAGLWVDADTQSRNGSGSTFKFYPKVEASIRVLRDVFIPYIRLDGGLEQNWFASIVDENPFYYASPESDMRTTSRSNDLEIGMRGTLTKAIGFKINVSSTKYEDFLYFVNDTLINTTGSRFTEFYDNLKVRSVGGHLSLNLIENLDIRLVGAIYDYDENGQDAAWNLPSTKWSVDLSYSLLDKFYVDASVTYSGIRSSVSQIDPGQNAIRFMQDGDVNYYNIELPSYVDANIGLEYRYNSRTSVWAKCSNLTNSSYRHWVGYPVQGIQALFGGSYSF
ncbi:MAG: TonB-dependent receptor [Bacteroidetes bacterium]|nr:TonB-dependent receptor [Bacteroidota bacterium]MDA0980590.1 TonB-dependent receptor [Bacteroidota bacterium]